MVEWATAVIIFAGCAALMAGGMAAMEAFSGYGLNGFFWTMVAITVLCLSAIGAAIAFGQAPPDRTPTRGYVIGLQIDPAHVEERCTPVGKAIICKDVAVSTRYEIKLQSPGGREGWRSVTSRVFEECTLDSFYERGRCAAAAR